MESDRTMTEPYTTRALLGDKVIYLDDCYPEGEIVTVREDFDDENSPLVGYYMLARNENRWVLNESDYQPPTYDYPDAR
jgi:hypothetical protein